ncbi:MAG: 3'-5' exonuclease [Bacteroidota bacterium]
MEIKKITQNLLFIDIETVSAEPLFENLTPRMQKLWERKASFIKHEEDLSASQLYFERAGIYAEFGKIIVIGVGFFYWNEANRLCLKVKTLTADNEINLLKDFKKLLEERFAKKESALCAHNGKEFDFPYLSRRMLINGIKLPKALDFSGKKPWEVPHYDTLEMWKFGDKKQYTSLETLSAVFGIESSKTDMAGDEVNSVYYKENNLEKIREYCLEDVVALAQIFLKLNAQEPVEQINIERIK